MADKVFKSRIRVAMVSQLFPLTHYTIFLGKSLDSFENEIEMLYYRSKSENNTVPLRQVKKVWSKSIKYPFEVFRQCVKDRPDVVHIQHEFNMFGDKMTAFIFPLLVFLLRIGRFKTVVTVHAVVPINDVDSFFAKTFAFPKKLPLLLKMMFIFIYSSISMFASAIIVHAAYSGSVMVNDYKAKPDKVFVAPIGVSEYVPIEIEKGKWSKVLEGKRSILFFGYLVERKGVEYLIEAFDEVSRRFPDLMLVIAGGVLSYSSSYVKRLTDLINKLGIDDHVIFLTTTPFPMDELHELYEISEFVVLPYTYSISSSLALSFAMEHSKPVIVTDIGVFKEEIDNKVDGLLCTPNSTESLKEAMEELLKSYNLRKTFSDNIQAKAKKRSWFFTAMKNKEVYSYILVSKHKSQIAGET